VGPTQDRPAQAGSTATDDTTASQQSTEIQIVTQRKTHPSPPGPRPSGYVTSSTTPPHCRTTRRSTRSSRPNPTAPQRPSYTRWPNSQSWTGDQATSTSTPTPATSATPWPSNAPLARRCPSSPNTTCSPPRHDEHLLLARTATRSHRRSPTGQPTSRAAVPRRPQRLDSHRPAAMEPSTQRRRTRHLDAAPDSRSPQQRHTHRLRLGRRHPVTRRASALSPRRQLARAAKPR
jgi:hypothetical protein